MLSTILAGAIAASSPRFEVPIACQPGRTCWIQKYADVAAGPDRRDYRCGAIATDGHDGIDFRIASLADMRRGVAVLAAAAGMVLRVRDGEPDVATENGAGDGREAGNGVVIDHGGGWVTQYSHLRRGSVHVRPGQRVSAGMPIGLVGLSGSTEYPHLHFSVRHGGKKVDPFSGAVLPSNCNARAAISLWSSAAKARLTYLPGQLVRLGITTAPQSVPITADLPSPSRREPLVVVADVISPQRGDIYSFELIGPRGEELLSRRATVEQPYLAWGPYAGVKAPPGGWASGYYTAKFSLSRSGKIVAQGESRISL